MPRQNELASLIPAGHGGWRPGAGRPRIHKSRVAHESREPFKAAAPVLVTLKVRKEVPRLRTGRFVRSFRRSLCQCCIRQGFRVVHYSIQSDHLHLIIEANDQKSLANGMKSLGARFARCVNRIFDRSGPVLKERFHHAVKLSPQEVRRALAYVLLNSRKHFRRRTGKNPPVILDEASSGRWFKGWTTAPPRANGHLTRFLQRTEDLLEVASPSTWLLRTGWKRSGGAIDPAGVPGAA